jgi:hypothetical protein
MPLDRGAVHREAVQRQTFIAVRTEDEILNGVLGTAHRAKAHERRGEFDLFGETEGW